MRSTAALALFAAVASAAPYNPFPLKDGFPSPNKAQLAGIQHRAGGTLPNTALPTKAKSGGITALQLIALNEIFEVAYFSELLTNITSGVDGYKKADLGKYAGDARNIIAQVRAQEELHALGANAILKSVGAEEIKPCKYNFPVHNFDEAIALAATVTEVVLSVLPGAQAQFSQDGGEEAGIIPLVGSIIGQEGEQTGFYRLIGKDVPSSAPFLTGTAPDFAFTAVQSFIVPGSCPNLNAIKGLKTFKPLTVGTKPTPKSKSVTYQVDGTVTSKGNSIVYLSGQNAPVAVPITDVLTNYGKTTFKADFPFESKGFAKGLTVAALVKGPVKKYANAQAVADNTIYGPGLITVE